MAAPEQTNRDGSTGGSNCSLSDLVLLRFPLDLNRFVSNRAS